MIETFDPPYDFLSNFYPCYVSYEGLTYPSSENAFQAAKTLDLGLREQFVSPPAWKAKKLGRRLVMRSDWDLIKFSVMKEILTIKFQDQYLKEQLLETGDQKLIEGNSWGDIIWGVCKGRGENHLGKLLMQLREELRCPENI